jgi:hypothetical protein
MQMETFTKSEMRALRRLAEIAWDRGLSKALDQLHHTFAEWKRGAMTSFELSYRIHEFHDGDARDLYKAYTGPHPSQTVAHALANHHIDASEIPDDLLAKLTPAVDFFTSLQANSSGDPS